MSYSIGLLTKHRETLKRDLSKSLESYSRGLITPKVHNTHKRNLKPKIADLTININKLKN